MPGLVMLSLAVDARFGKASSYQAPIMAIRIEDLAV